MIDHGDAARPHPFVVEAVVSGQLGVAEPLQCRIEINRESRRQHCLRDPAGEGLPFIFVLLAVALEPVAEDLVEEHRAGAAGEDRRTGVRVQRGGAPQRLQVADHPLHRPQHGLVVGQSRCC